jgi:hypothetical protein
MGGHCGPHPFFIYISFHIQGNSVETLPAYAERVQRGEAPPCDLLFVDGDHSYKGAKADFTNGAKASSEGAYLLADDHSASWPGVIKAFQELVQEGKLRPVYCQNPKEVRAFRGYTKGNPNPRP